jgi:phosphate-selective porin
MEGAVVNSYILYSLDKKECGEKLHTHLSYKRNLITQLVGNVRNRNSRKRGRPSSSDLEKRLNGKMHFIMQNETKPTKDCIVCSIQNEKRRKDRKHLLL